MPTRSLIQSRILRNKIENYIQLSPNKFLLFRHFSFLGLFKENMSLGNGVVADLCDERRTAWTLDIAHKAGFCSRNQFDESMTTFSFC